MTNLKDQMVLAIARNAANKTAELAGEFAHAVPEEKEAIAAGLDFERWLAETCRDSLD